MTTVQLEHTNLLDLTSLAVVHPQRWLRTACSRLRRLPDHSSNRVLVAREQGRVRAVLGLRMYWGANGRLNEAIICVLEVDPGHARRGIGSRLVRFAEGIARIHGCARVGVAPDLEGWGDGRCWPGLGYGDPREGLSKELRSVGDWKCA